MRGNKAIWHKALGGMRKSEHNKGFTLIELLVVIAVLAILVTAVLPFGGSMIDNTKKEKTVKLLESIRFGLIGAEYAYDANGNRVIGGYIGDFGELPDLITHYWDNDTKEWLIQYTTDTSSGTTEYIPEVYDTDGTGNIYTTYPEDKFNQNAMPLALWTNLVKIVDTTSGDTLTHQPLVDKDDWQGPYVVRERDDFTNDDDNFSYYDVAYNESPADELSDDELDEMRKFWLRQGGGRLLDGWGSALLFYMDDDDLYVVSAGSDRRINYGYYYLDDTLDYDNGPADTSLSGNEDNIVMVLTKEQWDLTNQKATVTRLMLQDLKTGIIGRRGNVTGGVQQPNGFVADIGGLETLVGSYVYDGTASTPIEYVYRCIKRHTNDGTTYYDLPSGGGENTYWKGSKIDDSTTTYVETLTADYPFATMWQSSGRTYYEAQPHLLLMNADYVYTGDDDDKTYYRYVKDEADTTATPSATSTEWAEDDTFEGHEWVLKHDTSTTYTSEILPSWTYYNTVEFGAGWRGPYTSYSSGPLTDAWGREIVLEMSKGSLVLRSRGPQVYVDESASTLVYYTDDDITETITQSDYSVPATVTVNAEENTSGTYLVEMNDEDYVSVYSAFNGGVGYFNALIDSAPTSGTGLAGTFYFTRADGHRKGPTDVTTDAGNTLAITAGVGAYSPDTDYENGVWLPIGKVKVVYRSKDYVTTDSSSSTPGTGSTNTADFYASPYPDTDLVVGTSGNTTSYKYQKTFLIHARTNPELVLGEE